jgi:hypothetical protein
MSHPVLDPRLVAAIRTFAVLVVHSTACEGVNLIVAEASHLPVEVVLAPFTVVLRCRRWRDANTGDRCFFCGRGRSRSQNDSEHHDREYRKCT